MKTPKFYKLNGFDSDYKTCSLSSIKLWLKDKYAII